MSLNPGSLFQNSDEFVDPDCMARYMEDALLRIAPSPDPDDSGKRGRRQFFIAISEGVIQYLRDHDGQNFFRVSVSGGGNVFSGTLDIL